MIGLGSSLTGELQHVSTDADMLDVFARGIPGTAMPAFSFNERQGWRLVAFVRSLRGEFSAGKDGDAAAGKALFHGRAGCTGCHRIGTEGGRHGPDLAKVAASTPPEELRRSIRHANAAVRPRHFRVRAVTGDGQRIEGLRLNEDSYSLQILDSEEKLVSLEKGALREYEIGLPSSRKKPVITPGP